MIAKTRIKRFARVCCAAVTALLFFAAGLGFQQVASASTEATKLEMIFRQQEEGAVVSAELFMHNPAGMAAGQVTVTYDQDVFTLQDVTPGAVLEEDEFIFQTNTEEPGVITIGWFSLEGTTDSCSLFKAIFKRETTGPIQLELQNIRLFNLEGDPIPFELEGLRLQLGKAAGWVNAVPLPLEAAPFMHEELAMVPLRFVCEQLGARVIWRPLTDQVLVWTEQKSIMLTIDSARALVDGQEEVLEASPVVLNGRVFVPLDFISKTFAADVVRYADTETIAITVVEEEPLPHFGGRVIVSGGGATFTNVTFKIYLQLNAAVNFGGTVKTSTVELGDNVTIGFVDDETVWFYTGDVNLGTFDLNLNGAAATVAGNQHALAGEGTVFFNETGLLADGIVFKTDAQIKEDAVFKDVAFAADAMVEVAADKILMLVGDIEIKDGYTVTFSGDGFVLRDDAEISGEGTAVFDGPNM